MEDKLINLEDMKNLFRKRLWIIIVVTALTTALGIYKTTQMAPTYTGSMKFLVSTSDKILDNYSENEIEAYSKFMATFNEIMKVGDFLDDTLKENKISKTSDQVKYSISY
ncbi:MAG: Wzz/FepE/Etk N-terminal domain-containing protein [Clostridium sp.]